MPKHHEIKGYEKTEEPEGSSNPRHLVEILNGIFQKLDLNHDRVLSQDELDREVLNAAIGEHEAEAVSILKACFTEVKDLHKEGWFARKNGITLADLLVFEQILLRQETDTTAISSHQHLQDIVSAVLQNVQIASKSQKSLYSNASHPIESIKVEAIRQGIVGDCFFLAALASLTVACPEIIPKMIETLDDGTYKVRFPGDRDFEIVVEQPTIVELALYAKCSRFGTWPAVLEKAYGQYLMLTQHKKTIIPADATHAAQHTFEAFDLLSGQTGHWEFLPLLEESKLIEILHSAFREKRAVAAGSCPSHSGITADGMASSHAYSITGWNSSSEVITLRNPWGRLTEEAAATHPSDDGVFRLTLAEFRRNFLAIYFEDWTPDARFEDY